MQIGALANRVDEKLTGSAPNAVGRFVHQSLSFEMHYPYQGNFDALKGYNLVN